MGIIKRKVPLIYILSCGRSGSTLLDLMLGVSPDIWTSGEVQLLPFELRDDVLPCGCGLSVNQCDFWKDVLQQPELLHTDLNYITHFREYHQGGKAVRLAYIYDILRRKPKRKSMSEVAKYGEINYLLFDSIERRANKIRGGEVKWIVDASKDMYRLFWLSQSNLFDLRVIHLIKDPRAFVYSMTKKVPANEIRPYVLRYTLRWIVENWLFHYLCQEKSMQGRSFRLRYEDLAANPDSTLMDLGNWLDVKFDLPLDNKFRENENHAIAGNPMRREKSGVFLDQKWKKEMTDTHTHLVWLLSGKLAVSFEYSKY